MSRLPLLGLLGLLACTAPEPQPERDADQQEQQQEQQPPVVVRVELDGAPRAGGGKLVVQAEYDPAGRITLPDPAVDRLEFTRDGPLLHEQVGDRTVATQHYVFRGPSGNYEIPPLTAVWTGPEGEVRASSTPVFVDIDAPPPRPGELADIVDPAPVRRIAAKVITVASLVLVLIAGGAALAFVPWRLTRPAPPPPPSPDQIALAAWERVRRDPHLTIDDKAREVARIFRDYVEAVLGFEATSRTTREILDHLEGMVHLPEGNVVRARRVLRAADRIKFAEHRPAGDWLEELDADLRGFVRDTRPGAWRTEGSGTEPGPGPAAAGGER